MATDGEKAHSTSAPTSDYVPGTVSLSAVPATAQHVASMVHGPDQCDCPVAAGPYTEPRYELREEIARGGMGAIHAARDVIFNREVAVKVLRDEFRSHPKHARRFVAEGQITAQLQHPAIPPVHDLGTLPDGRPFLAMKLIKGRTLADLLGERTDPVAEHGRFIAVFEQICQAVGYAHSRGVIHRDLKPANVMVGAFGEVQVMDWGLAKVLAAESGSFSSPSEVQLTAPADGAQTGAGSVLGTPAFMPPEQAGGDTSRIDKRADVFGLGAILTMILTGSPPYVGPDSRGVLSMAVRGKLDEAFARLDASGADPALIALAKKCLAVEPAQRLEDALEVAMAVSEFRSSVEERARRAELELEKTRLRRYEVIRRWRAAFGTILTVFLAIFTPLVVLESGANRLWLMVALLVPGLVGSLAFVLLVARPDRKAGYRPSDLFARKRRAEPGAAPDPARISTSGKA